MVCYVGDVVVSDVSVGKSEWVKVDSVVPDGSDSSEKKSLVVWDVVVSENVRVEKCCVVSG